MCKSCNETLVKCAVLDLFKLISCVVVVKSVTTLNMKLSLSITGVTMNPSNGWWSPAYILNSMWYDISNFQYYLGEYNFILMDSISQSVILHHDHQTLHQCKARNLFSNPIRSLHVKVCDTDLINLRYNVCRLYDDGLYATMHATIEE